MLMMSASFEIVNEDKWCFNDLRPLKHNYILRHKCEDLLIEKEAEKGLDEVY